MSTCNEILDLLSARLDGKLTPEQETALAEHLTCCPVCRNLAEDLADIHAVMPSLNVTPPAAIMENVMARIKAAEAKVVSFPTKKQPSRQWRTLGAAAAVFAVVLVGAVALRGGISRGEVATLDVPAPAGMPSATPSASAEIAQRGIPTEEKHGIMSSAEEATEKNTIEHGDQSVSTQKDTAANHIPTPMPSATPQADAGAAAPQADAGAATPRADAGAATTTGGGVPRMAQAMTAAAEAPPQMPVTFNDQKVETRCSNTFDAVRLPKTACRTLLEHLKAENYPDLDAVAPWEGATLIGTAETDDLAYALAPVTVEGETYTWQLAYVGISQNRRYYEFNLYAEVTDGSAVRTVQGGWYGVAVADGTILTAQDDMDTYETAVTEE